MMMKFVKAMSLLMVFTLLLSGNVFAGKLTDELDVSIEEVKKSIENELAMNEAQRALISGELPGDIIEMETRVLFDYTADQAILSDTLIEPTDVYADVTMIKYENDTQDAIGITPYYSYQFNKRVIRSFYGVSITLTLTVYTDEKTIYASEHGNMVCHQGISANLTSSSSSSVAYVRTVDLKLEQFGTNWVNQRFDSYKKYNSQTYSSNTGVSCWVYSNVSNFYVNLGRGFASYIGADADMLIQWQTGPGSTGGERYNMQVGQGDGWPTR